MVRLEEIVVQLAADLQGQDRNVAVLDGDGLGASERLELGLEPSGFAAQIARVVIELVAQIPEPFAALPYVAVAAHKLAEPVVTAHAHTAADIASGRLAVVGSGSFVAAVEGPGGFAGSSYRASTEQPSVMGLLVSAQSCSRSR